MAGVALLLSVPLAMMAVVRLASWLAHGIEPRWWVWLRQRGRRS